jgi:two-component system phosphate regulon response regulator PhoB/two-component system alkaline phosphatase synthesis response regulator PhoP
MITENRSTILQAQTNSKTIVIVDDEPDIVELVTLHLNKSGFRVKSFELTKDLLQYLLGNIPDLILLDLMLPDGDGIDICKLLKREDRTSGIPIIMVTARIEEMDRILGLEIGADDYVTKPFSPRELVARIKAVLRRNEKVKEVNRILVGDSILIDLQKYEVFVNENKIELTSTEFKILKLLTEKIGWVYSRDSILKYLGINEKGVLDRTVDVHIKNLREKLGDASKFIKNIRGIGYKIEEN